MSLSGLYDIDVYLLDFFDINTLCILASLNSYINEIVCKNMFYKEMKQFKEIENVKFFVPINKWDSLFIKACNYGNIQITKYIYYKYQKNINIYASEEKAFYECYKRDDLEMLLLFLNQDTTAFCTFENFVNCCSCGCIKIIKWIYEESIKINQPIDIHINKESPFRWCISSGKIDSVIWFYDFSIEMKSPINIRIKNDSLFRKACERNHFDIAKYLYNKSIQQNSIFDISASNECAFSSACYNGNLEMAKWLFEISVQQNKLINFNNEYAMILNNICAKPHYEILEWILFISNQYNIPFDLCIENDHIFKKCCEDAKIYSKDNIHKNLASITGLNIDAYAVSNMLSKQIKLAKWLCSHVDKYHIEIYDNKLIQWKILK